VRELVTTGSLLNGMAMCLIGVLPWQIGTGCEQRHGALHDGLLLLADGVGLVSIALGCFGSPRSKNLDNKDGARPFNGKIHLMPTGGVQRIIPAHARQRDRLLPGILPAADP